MNEVAYAEFVCSLVKDPRDILTTLDYPKIDLLHMTLGISGEAGELLDAVKKQVVYNKPIDRQNLIEELGDIEFYMEGMRQCLGLTRQEVIEANVAKLGKRYSGKYSDEQAIARKDKQDD